MSAKYTFLAWDTPIENAPLKLALLQLANNADDDGFSYYSISKMAQSCGMSNRTFMRKISELEKMGVLTVERRANRPSLYTLIGDEMGVSLCHLQEAEVTESHSTVTESHLTGDRESHDLNSTPNNHPDNNKLIVKPEAKPSKYKFNDDQMNFAKSMYEFILRVAPAIKKPNLEAWANTARLINEIDGIELIDAWHVFAWANADSFWQTNILSADKFRKQYAQLSAKMNGNSSNSKQDIMQQSSNSNWHEEDLGL